MNKMREHCCARCAWLTRRQEVNLAAAMSDLSELEVKSDEEIYEDVFYCTHEPQHVKISDPYHHWCSHYHLWKERKEVPPHWAVTNSIVEWRLDEVMSDIEEAMKRR